MSKAYFVTGTDTDCGKTYLTARLAEVARQVLGVSPFVYKPVAAGAHWRRGRLENEDLLYYQNRSIEAGCSYLFAPFIAPHVAADRVGMVVDGAVLSQCVATLRAAGRCLLVEGAGGWKVPLSHHLCFSDWVVAQNLPVVVVVEIKLGCINHARLTVESIKASGGEVSGWYANRVGGDAYANEQVAALTEWLGCSPLAEVPTDFDISSPATKAERALFLGN